MEAKILLGAGTVTDRVMALGALEAGAEFLVTPCLVPDVIAAAAEHDVAALPGAMTPTEVFSAWRLGGDIVKVFPASHAGGASYLKALKGPFPQIELCPTGGVNLDTIAAFIEAGAVAVGVGGELVLKSALASGAYGRITVLARDSRPSAARAESPRAPRSALFDGADRAHHTLAHGLVGIASSGHMAGSTGRAGLPIEPSASTAAPRTSRSLSASARTSAGMTSS